MRPRQRSWWVTDSHPITVNVMQVEASENRTDTYSAKSSSLHKDILRLALCYRTRSKRIDALLNRLSALSSEDKAKNIDHVISEILDEIITLSESQPVDLLSKFVFKLDALGLSFPSAEKILDGDRNATTAESLAGDIAKIIQAPAPEVASIAEFCTSLPVTENLKREIKVLQDEVIAGKQQLECIETLKNVVEQLHTQLIAPPTNTGPESTNDQNDNTQLLLELMNLIDFPRSAHAEADEVRKKLSEHRPGSNLLALLNEISALIERSRTDLETEIDRLTKFLAELVARIEKLDTLLLKAAQYHDESSISHGKLQRDIEHQVSMMQDGLRDGENINEIRTLVSTRIDKLSANISDFLNQENKRQQQASAQVSEMAQTVNALESKTAKLYRDLEQQKKQLEIDPLTQILNRSGYCKIIDRAIAQFRKNHTGFSLSVFDIDHFKRINDTFGHLAGDKVLKNLAKQVQAEINAEDHLCRYGGEEFVIVMPNQDGTSAHEAMDRLRAKVEKYHFHHNETTVPVTISCGTAAFRAADDADSIFERADQALYDAKHNGRNQSRLAS